MWLLIPLRGDSDAFRIAACSVLCGVWLSALAECLAYGLLDEGPGVRLRHHGSQQAPSYAKGDHIASLAQSWFSPGLLTYWLKFAHTAIIPRADKIASDYLTITP